MSNATWASGHESTVKESSLMSIKSLYRYIRSDAIRTLVVVCSLLFLLTAIVYVSLGFLPSGDEPHYLVISQTILKYHSLDVMRDYNNGDYRVFYPIPLMPQVTHNARGQLLAMHDIGAPLLWLLPYLLLGRLGAVLFISTISVLLVVNIYKMLLTMGIGEKYAFLVSLAYGIASPIYLYAHLTFVEPIGALVSIYVLRKVFQKEVRVSEIVTSSILLGILPWTHIRFAVIEIPLFFLLLYRLYKDNKLQRIKPYLFYLLPITALFLLLELYNYKVWGTLNPAIDQVNNNNVPFARNPLPGMLGIFFDQEYGILLNFPMFLFLIVGVVLTTKRRFVSYTIAVLIVSLPYILTFSTLRHWSGGWCPPARFLMTLLPLYAFYVAYALEKADSKFARGWLTFSFVYGFVYNVLSLLPVQNGFNGESGRNHTLIYLQLFGHHLTDLFPSFFLPNQSGFIALWVAVFVALAALVLYSGKEKLREEVEVVSLTKRV